MNDRGIKASHLMIPLSSITIPDITSQFKLSKVPNSIRVNDLLLHNTIPITLYYNLLTFPDTGKEFELQGDLLKMTTKETTRSIMLTYRIKRYCMILRRKLISM